MIDQQEKGQALYMTKGRVREAAFAVAHIQNLIIDLKRDGNKDKDDALDEVMHALFEVRGYVNVVENQLNLLRRASDVESDFEYVYSDEFLDTWCSPTGKVEDSVRRRG